MQKNSPIILLSSERSGTNLLRSLIDNHSRICAPLPPHLLNEFYPLRHYYHDLRNQENSIHLISDMLNFLKLSYHDWKLQVSANEIYEDYRPTSLVDIFNSIYRTKAKAEGKSRFCSMTAGLLRLNLIVIEVMKP